MEAHLMAQPTEPSYDILSHEILSMVNIGKPLENGSCASITLK